jgi:anti-sigma regulatory factor (Ser/Thr protein kinase)
MQVRVEAADDVVRVTLTDWGLPFDEDSAYLDVDVPVEARAEGGMGVLLVHKLMDDVTRKTASAPGGPNVLTLTKHVGVDVRPADADG